MRLRAVEGVRQVDDRIVTQAAALLDTAGRVVMAVSGDRLLAEDCAQEALVRAWQHLSAGEELRSLEAWTVRVALNLCRAHHRRSGSEAKALKRLDAEHEDSSGAEVPLGARVQAAVLALPPRQREVVVLHYLADMDVASIAAAAEISEGAVKNALFNARLTLARRLGVKEDA